MLTKIVIIAFLIAIVTALMSSLVFLVRDPSDRQRTLRGLKLRVGLSVSLILFVLLSYQMGWIRPHALIPTPAPAAAP
jgi:amino acid transporter